MVEIKLKEKDDNKILGMNIREMALAIIIVILLLLVVVD